MVVEISMIEEAVLTTRTEHGPNEVLQQPGDATSEESAMHCSGGLNYWDSSPVEPCDGPLLGGNRLD